MRRKQREGVARGLLDLALCQIAHLLQARAREIGTRELGTGEIGALKERLSEIGAGEIGAVEPGIAQIGVPKVSPGQIGARECGETQRGVPEARGRKIDGSATDRPHLPLADAERDTGQIRDGRGILRAPSIPRPRAAAQRFDMLGLCGHNARNNEKRNSHERYKMIRNAKRNTTKSSP